ncbi:MAG: hypothetical protein QOE60_199 [Thermoleophilaceae bacterium]|nr:hypothetical protein [Thermoleophilaceae bacterium]
MVEESDWAALTDEQLRGVRGVLLRTFLATLAVVLVAVAVASALGLGREDSGPLGPAAFVRTLYPPGSVSDLSCKQSPAGWLCSYRRDRYACTVVYGGRPHCSVTASRRSDPAPAGRSARP